MEYKQLQALISLLDDTDSHIYEEVSRKIIEIGPQVVQELESVWELSSDEILQERIEEIIDNIHLNEIQQKLILWLSTANYNLLQGAMLAAKIQYPDLKTGIVHSQIEKIKHDIWMELSDQFTPLEVVNIFNQIFYKHYDFGGKLEESYQLNNNVISSALERREGSPIMLGVIYLIIARQLQLPIFGINLPQHFALTFCKYNSKELTEPKATPNSAQVLFYINPIRKGTIFSLREAKNYLKKMNIVESQKYFAPISDKEVIFLLFSQLKQAYLSNNNDQKAQAVNNLLTLFDEEE